MFAASEDEHKGMVFNVQGNECLYVSSRLLHSSRFSFRLPQCVSLRAENTRSCPWFIARSIPTRA